MELEEQRWRGRPGDMEVEAGIRRWMERMARGQEGKEGWPLSYRSEG